MRRNATKVAAAVLSLAVTMTSVNLPTTAAAATKKVKLNKTKATLRVGKTTTLKVTKGGKKVKATFTSNKKKIATVGKKTGKVKAKKKGTATITAKYAGKKYKCKITVKKKVTTPTAKPTVKPTATPTAAPTATPTAAPTQTPAALTIASASAVAADTIKVNLTAPLPDGATLKLAKKGSTGTVSVKQELDAEKKVATLKSDANYSTGTYVVTLTSGGKDIASVEVAVESQKVAKIEVLNKNKKALTSTDRRELYVYYDVKDQYGNSIKEKATINWSSSTGRIERNDKAKGCLILKKVAGAAQDEQFKYGDPVHILGVDINSGVTCNDNLTVDMQRALAEVRFKGFIDKRADAKEANITQELPTDFAKERYLLLFDALDQEGQLLDADDYVSANAGSTSRAIFQVNQPTLVKSVLNKGGTYTITGANNTTTTYCSVEVNPGMYVDRGGDVTFTAISNTTGMRTDGNYRIGNGQLLKSLVLSDPGNLADGDTDKEIAYTATAVDKDGNEISGVTNYETIVRSTNKLKLNASEGTITVYQKDDGTAGIKWSDSKISLDGALRDRSKYFSKGNYSAYDNIDRNVSLSTIVVNGESSHTALKISDARRPVSVESVKLNSDNNNMITEKAKAEINLFGITDDTQHVVYRDQYGQKLDKEKAEAFFRWTNSIDKGFDGSSYGVYVDYSSAVNTQKAGEGDTPNNRDSIYATVGTNQQSYIKEDWNKNGNTLTTRNGHNIYLATNDSDNQTKLVLKTNADYSDTGAYTKNIKYSVVRQGKGSNNITNSGGFVPGVNDGNNSGPISAGGTWSMVESEKNITYTIVPVKNLTGLQFKDIKKIRIETSQSQYSNGQAMNNSTPPNNDKQNWENANTWAGTPVTATGGTLTEPEVITKDREVIITGSYNGNTITIPNTYYDIKSQNNNEQAFVVNDSNFKIDTINASASAVNIITYGDLYNFNDAKNLRRDAKKSLSIDVYNKLMTDVDKIVNAQEKIDTRNATVRTNVTITDARESVAKIAFKDNKTSLTLRPENTEYDFGNKKLGDYTVEVRNDCDDIVDNKNYKLEFTVSDYVENTTTVTNHAANDNKYTHLPKSFIVKKNGTEFTKIDGAEIGDKFNLTVSLVDKNNVDLNSSIKVPVTVGHDGLARMSYGEGIEFDEGHGTTSDLRDTLDYDR